MEREYQQALNHLKEDTDAANRLQTYWRWRKLFPDDDCLLKKTEELLVYATNVIESPNLQMVVLQDNPTEDEITRFSMRNPALARNIDDRLALHEGLVTQFVDALSSPEKRDILRRAIDLIEHSAPDCQ